jgi:hypothetical protein
MGDTMSEFPRRVLIIIPAAYQAAANQASLAFDPIGGAETFTVGLSETGAEPATHFWASIQMREETFQGVQQLLPAQFPNAVMVEYNMDAEPNRPAEVLEEMGLQVMAQANL